MLYNIDSRDPAPDPLRHPKLIRQPLLQPHPHPNHLPPSFLRLQVPVPRLQPNRQLCLPPRQPYALLCNPIFVPLHRFNIEMPQQTSEDKTHLTSSEILPYTVAWAEGERWRVRFQSNLKRESWLSNQRVRKVPWRGVYCELMDAYASLTGAVCQCSSKRFDVCWLEYDRYAGHWINLRPRERTFQKRLSLHQDQYTRVRPCRPKKAMISTIIQVRE